MFDFVMNTTQEKIPGFSCLSERQDSGSRAVDEYRKMVFRRPTTDDSDVGSWKSAIVSKWSYPWGAGTLEPLLGQIMEHYRPWEAASDLSAPFDHVRRKLRGFRVREHGWDGFQGVPASEGAVQDAAKFLQLIPTISPLPRPGLSGDGEVGLFWDYGEGFIDVGFLGDGTYSYFARDMSGSEIFGDERQVVEGIDEGLRRFIADYK